MCSFRNELPNEITTFASLGLGLAWGSTAIGITQAPSLSEGVAIEMSWFLAIAATTLSEILGGRISGHFLTAWYEIPMVLAANATLPPNKLIAYCLSINQLNHGLFKKATFVYY